MIEIIERHSTPLNLVILKYQRKILIITLLCYYIIIISIITYYLIFIGLLHLKELCPKKTNINEIKVF